MLKGVHLLKALALVLGGIGLQANDFKPLLDVARETWPEKRHIGVVCNYRLAEDTVRTLADAVGPGVLITVVDTRIHDQVEKAAVIARGRWMDYVVLLPNGGVVCDGSFGATVLTHRLAKGRIPVLATSPRSLSNGVLFALGPATQGRLLMGDRLIGVVDVVLPREVEIIKKAQLLPAPGPAAGGRIQVIPAE